MRHKLRSSLAFSLNLGRFLPLSAHLRLAAWAAVVLSSLAFGACAPKLGDGCQRTAECSVNGDRTCDRSQPGGYCTIPDCEANGCPDDGACVRFQPDEPRLSRSWCMASCGNTKDCDRDRYVCRSADQLNEANQTQLGADEDPENDEAETDTPASQSTPGPRVAEVLDRDPKRKFCVVDEQD